MKRQGGFTIVEVLVSAAIAGMLMTVVASLLTMVGRSYEEQRDRASLQGELLLAREDLLEWLTGAAIPILPSEDQLITATFRQRGVPQYEAGVPQWQQFFGYRKNGSSLIRSTLDFTPTATLPALPSNLDTFPGAGKVTVARDISGLTFTLQDRFVDATIKVQSRDTTLEGTFSCLLEDGLLP